MKIKLFNRETFSNGFYSNYEDMTTDLSIIVMYEEAE